MKQPLTPEELRDMNAAVKHWTIGMGRWDWASTDQGGEPDVVPACAGDIATMEALAAVSILKQEISRAEDTVRERGRPLPADAGERASAWALRPRLRFTLHGNKAVIFNVHGYASLIQKLSYRRANHDNFHVRGYLATLPCATSSASAAACPTP